MVQGVHGTDSQTALFSHILPFAQDKGLTELKKNMSMEHFDPCFIWEHPLYTQDISEEHRGILHIACLWAQVSYASGRTDGPPLRLRLRRHTQMTAKESLAWKNCAAWHNAIICKGRAECCLLFNQSLWEDGLCYGERKNYSARAQDGPREMERN